MLSLLIFVLCYVMMNQVIVVRMHISCLCVDDEVMLIVYFFQMAYLCHSIFVKSKPYLQWHPYFLLEWLLHTGGSQQ